MGRVDPHLPANPDESSRRRSSVAHLCQPIGGSEFPAIVETATQVDDPDAAEVFHRDVLGVEGIGKETGRHVSFRVGRGVFLAFDHATRLGGGRMPPHGREGSGPLVLGDVEAALDELLFRGGSLNRKLLRGQVGEPEAEANP